MPYANQLQLTSKFLGCEHHLEQIPLPPDTKAILDQSKTRYRLQFNDAKTTAKAKSIIEEYENELIGVSSAINNNKQLQQILSEIHNKNFIYLMSVGTWAFAESLAVTAIINFGLLPVCDVFLPKSLTIFMCHLSALAINSRAALKSSQAFGLFAPHLEMEEDTAVAEAGPAYS